VKATGSCLCGDVAFTIDGELSEIEICHCPRCRKVSGSTFSATLYVHAADFQWLRGRDQLQRYEAPILSERPAYAHAFCWRCGSPLPIEIDALRLVELPAAVLDETIPSRPVTTCSCRGKRRGTRSPIPFRSTSLRRLWKKC
jgi:hypothetical protein